jgi:hypothetical protein
MLSAKSDMVSYLAVRNVGVQMIHAGTFGQKIDIRNFGHRIVDFPFNAGENARKFAHGMIEYHRVEFSPDHRPPAGELRRSGKNP